MIGLVFQHIPVTFEEPDWNRPFWEILGRKRGQGRFYVPLLVSRCGLGVVGWSCTRFTLEDLQSIEVDFREDRRGMVFTLGLDVPILINAIGTFLCIILLVPDYLLTGPNI